MKKTNTRKRKTKKKPLTSSRHHEVEIVFALVASLPLLVLSYLALVLRSIPLQEHTPISTEQQVIKNVVATTEKISQPERKETQKETPRRVRVDGGKFQFSLVVPDEWYVEARNGIDREMNTEELRNFLSSNPLELNGEPWSRYADFSVAEIGVMDEKRLHSLLRPSGNVLDRIPTASVAQDGPHGGISYTDWNTDQVDFFAVERNAGKQEIGRLRRTFGTRYKWGEEMVGNIMATVAVEKLGPTGVEKGMAGGKILFIPLVDLGKTIIIRKQARGDAQFEQEFSALLESLQVEEMIVPGT